MNGREHYRAAESLLDEVPNAQSVSAAAVAVAGAQAHAQLAALGWQVDLATDQLTDSTRARIEWHDDVVHRDDARSGS